MWDTHVVARGGKGVWTCCLSIHPRRRETMTRRCINTFTPGTLTSSHSLHKGGGEGGVELRQKLTVFLCLFLNKSHRNVYFSSLFIEIYDGYDTILIKTIALCFSAFIWEVCVSNSCDSFKCNFINGLA